MIDIPGIILAGGLSRRMGGGDKGLLMLGKTTIIERVIDKISPQVGSLAININGDSSRFPDYKLPIIPDSIKGYLGPLSGILAGMEWAFKNGNRYIATVAADTPFLPDDFIKRLHAMVKSKNLNIGIAASRFLRRDDVFIHPTFGIWEVALKDDLRDALANDTRKIMFWAKKFKLDYYYFDTSDKLSDPFFNINTPDDLEEAKYRLKKRSLMKYKNVFGIVGWKNSGKTTLVESLVKYLTEQGYQVSTIKHAHHSFDIDHEGTDSFRHRKAGAKEVILASRKRWALIHELIDEPEKDFDFLVNSISPTDLILVEGFKEERHNKIEVIRAENKKIPIYKNDNGILAIVSDYKIPDISLPIFNLDEISNIADFILKKTSLK